MYTIVYRYMDVPPRDVVTFGLQVVSDLHTEVDNTGFPRCLEPVARNIALCGDIGRPDRPEYHELLDHCAERFQNVFVLMGNHEYYHQTREGAERAVSASCARFPNVHFLNRTGRRVEIGGGVCLRVLGCTLWSHVPDVAATAVSHYLNDYRLIYRDSDSKVCITVDDTNEMHARDRTWLEHRLADESLPTVVLTHHAPLAKGTSHPRHEEYDNHTNRAFATDLSTLMRPQVRLWAFGHTHYPCDFQYQGVRVVSNPHGYERESHIFEPRKVYHVEIPI
jgi:predicted phosphodiesterase